MQKEEFITRLLNFGDDWKITDIRVNTEFKEIDIFLEYIKSTGLYPRTNEECKIYDYMNSRRLRHLDIFEYKTFINARVPRVINDKSEINSIELSWADSRVSYTYLFEDKIIETLLLSKNQTKTSDYFDISFDKVHRIMQRAVNRGLTRRKLDGIYALSIDEKSFKEGHNYLTILSDPINKCVLDIIEGRKTDDACELITSTLSTNQLSKIELVTMDMWAPFMSAVEEIMPQANIAHDKFHTAKYLNKGVDDVRKQEVKEQEILKNSKYIFLKDKSKWTAQQSKTFEEINQINLTTSQAWHLKENFKGIYEQGTQTACLKYFEQWYKNTLEANIKPMIKVADTILKHLKGVVNSALTSITNSIAENLNSQIQVIKSVARGFANFNAYRNAILFFNAKLDMFSLKNL